MAPLAPRLRAWIDALNARDTELIAGLMTDDHLFVDALGWSDRGRQEVIRAWEGYFSMVPDYFVHIDCVLTQGDEIALFGRAGGTYTSDGELCEENQWETLSSWLVRFDGERVAEWRVFADNLPIRQAMERDSMRMIGSG